MSPSPARPPQLAIEITVVAASADTRRGLADYLARAGADVQATALLPACAGTGRRAAVVIFADDYERPEVLRAVSALRSASAAPVVVVVAQDVDLLVAASHGEPPPGVVVLRRPPWGWAVLEAIRTQLGDAPANEEP